MSSTRKIKQLSALFFTDSDRQVSHLIKYSKTVEIAPVHVYKLPFVTMQVFTLKESQNINVDLTRDFLFLYNIKYASAIN